jgi:alpha-glucosidase
MRPENHEVFRQLRAVVEEFGPGRVLIGETYPPIDFLPLYYGQRNDEFHTPFNFTLLTQSELNPVSFRSAVAGAECFLKGRPTNYVLSNHDNRRAWDKFGDDKHNDEIAKMLALMLLTLRGKPFFYYGEEIGMKTTPPERREDVRDPVGRVLWPNDKGRDGERTPMQWTGGRNAGFSTAKETWLPVPPTAATRNVATMESAPHSLLNFYKQAIHLRRKSSALLNGDYQTIGNDLNVFAYSRHDKNQTMIIALNMSGESQTIHLDVDGRDGVSTLKVDLSSVDSRSGSVLDARRLTLAPYEAVVLEKPSRR